MQRPAGASLLLASVYRLSPYETPTLGTATEVPTQLPTLLHRAPALHAATGVSAPGTGSTRSDQRYLPSIPRTNCPPGASEVTAACTASPTQLPGLLPRARPPAASGATAPRTPPTPAGPAACSSGARPPPHAAIAPLPPSSFCLPRSPRSWPPKGGDRPAQHSTRGPCARIVVRTTTCAAANHRLPP